MKKIFSICISLIPFIMHIGIGGVSLDTILFFIIAIYGILSLAQEGTVKIKKNFINLFSVLLCLYITFSTLFFGGALSIQILIPWIVLLLCIEKADYVFDQDLFIKAIVFISVIASILVFIQTILYYSFGLGVSFCPLFLFKNNVVEQYSVYHSELMTYGGLFRPCAFFLEPAIFTEYCSVGLALSLYGKYKKSVPAIIITVGMLLTTSGIGIIVTVVLWCIYGVMSGNVSKTLKYLFGFGIIAIVIYFVLNKLGIWSLIIARFDTTNDQSGVLGRLGNANKIFGSSLALMIFGRGYTANPNYYLTGIFRLIYKIGYLGTGVYVSYIISFFGKVRNGARVIVGLFVFYLFAANLISFSYFVFFFLAATSYSEDSNWGLERGAKVPKNIIINTV